MPETNATTGTPELVSPETARPKITAASPIKRRLIVNLGGLAILALAFGVVWLQSSKYEPLTVGMLAPDFSLPDLDGKTRPLPDYRGKVVLLHFWATGCKPCKEEMPSVEIVWDNFRAAEFVRLA